MKSGKEISLKFEFGLLLFRDWEQDRRRSVYETRQGKFPSGLKVVLFGRDMELWEVDTESEFEPSVLSSVIEHRYEIP